MAIKPFAALFVVTTWEATSAKPGFGGECSIDKNESAFGLDSSSTGEPISERSSEWVFTRDFRKLRRRISAKSMERVVRYWAYLLIKTQKVPYLCFFLAM